MTPSTSEPHALTVAIGQQLQSDYQVHELPSGGTHASDSHPQTEVLVNTALLAHIEYLEAGNT